ncbi:MAG: ATP-binding protein [Acetobacteraceae bacterium]
MQSLADGFDRLERGDYRPIPPVGIAELRRVGEQFNHLARSLHRVTDDNHRLIDKLESVQEQERKELAAELHDAIGPALFGIRAETACIMRSVPHNEAAASPVLRSARMIAELTDGIQKLNYRMLDRLRPLVLEQMGLAEALRRLVGSSQRRYPQITWSLTIPEVFDEPPEALRLMLYRAAEESVTNVIRHAGASAVEIRLRRHVGHITVCVRDDGHGLPADFRHGFGLLGMGERVRRFCGSMTIANATLSGVLLEVSVPEQSQADVTEAAYAHPAD